MGNISRIKQEQFDILSQVCNKNNIPIEIISKLLDAEKVKKLLKRRALIQETIDIEIEKTVSDEN